VRHFDTHPRAKVIGRAVRQQAMAIDLRRRSKQYVMVSNANRNRLPMAHNFARARVDCAVERMDSVAEVRDESVEPLGQRVDAFSLARVDSCDCGLNFADGNCREE